MPLGAPLCDAVVSPLFGTVAAALAAAEVGFVVDDDNREGDIGKPRERRRLRALCERKLCALCARGRLLTILSYSTSTFVSVNCVPLDPAGCTVSTCCCSVSEYKFVWLKGDVSGVEWRESRDFPDRDEIGEHKDAF